MRKSIAISVAIGIGAGLVVVLAATGHQHQAQHAGRARPLLRGQCVTVPGGKPASYWGYWPQVTLIDAGTTPFPVTDIYVAVFAVHGPAATQVASVDVQPDRGVVAYIAPGQSMTFSYDGYQPEPSWTGGCKIERVAAPGF